MLVGRVRGFTLVELALAMAFVGVLSISIVLIISNTVTAYQRGLTLTRVNSVGIDLVNDMRLTISNSSARGIVDICGTAMFRSGVDGDSLTSLGTADAGNCRKDNAYKYIYVVNEKQVEFEDGSSKTIPIYGAFCTGNYSYLWNSGYFIAGNGVKNGQLNSNEWLVLSYLGDDGKMAPPYNNSGYFRLIKVKDSNKAICVAMRNTGGESRYSDGVTNQVNISNIGNGQLEGGEPIDLLPNDGGNNLALYDLYVAEPAMSGDDNMFYSVSFVLGTTSGGADILAKGNSCAAPNDSVNGSSNYCAINKFNFAIQVNGGK